MFKPNLRSMLRSSLHPFGVLSESIDELIDNKVIWNMIPKRFQNLLWQINLRAGNLHHMSEIDNWGSHEPFNKICCKLGRHDYFCHSLLKPRGGGDIGVVLKCMRCGYNNHTNIVNKQMTVVSDE